MNQMPFATMKALNATAVEGQNAEKAGILERFIVRRRPFVLNTIKIQRSDFATKAKLQARVSVDPARNMLMKFEDGGTEESLVGGSLAIPVDAKRNKSDIVTKANRPKAYQLQTVSRAGGGEIAKGMRRTFLIRSADGRGGLSQRVGRGAGSTIRELFTFKKSVPVDQRLEFEATIAKVTATRFPVNMREWLARALATAR